MDWGASSALGTEDPAYLAPAPPLQARRRLQPSSPAPNLGDLQETSWTSVHSLNLSMGFLANRVCSGPGARSVARRFTASVHDLAWSQRATERPRPDRATALATLSTGRIGR